MPIYMEISRLHRCVTIVARGELRPDEIMGAAKQLFDAQVPQFAKIVDVAAASAEVSSSTRSRELRPFCAAALGREAWPGGLPHQS